MRYQKCILSFSDGTTIFTDLALLVATMNVFSTLNGVYPAFVDTQTEFLLLGEHAKMISMNRTTLLIKMPPSERGELWERVIIPIIEDQVIAIESSLRADIYNAYGITFITRYTLSTLSTEYLDSFQDLLNNEVLSTAITKWIKDNTISDIDLLFDNIDDVVISYYEINGKIIPSLILDKYGVDNTNSDIGIRQYSDELRNAILCEIDLEVSESIIKFSVIKKMPALSQWLTPERLSILLAKLELTELPPLLTSLIFSTSDDISS